MRKLPVQSYSVELRTTVTQLVHVRAISRREAIGMAEEGLGTLIEEETTKRTAVYVTETDPIEEDDTEESEEGEEKNVDPEPA